MNEEKTHIAFFGVEGGGFDLFIYTDGTCEESGSSGGFLEDEDDPIIHWNEKFPNLKEWWDSFTLKNVHIWYYFFVSDIHPHYKEVLKEFALQTIDAMDETEKERIDIQMLSNNWRFS